MFKKGKKKVEKSLEVIISENFKVDWEWLKEFAMGYDPYIDKDTGEVCNGSDVELARAVVDLKHKIDKLGVKEK